MERQRAQEMPPGCGRIACVARVCRRTHHVVVVGAGYMGLLAAAQVVKLGYIVTILERQSALGGVWRQWANPWSTLQSHSSTYMLEAMPGVSQELGDFANRSQVLQHFEEFAHRSGLGNRISYGVNVTGIRHRQLRISPGHVVICHWTFRTSMTTATKLV